MTDFRIDVRRKVIRALGAVISLSFLLVPLFAYSAAPDKAKAASAAEPPDLTAPDPLQNYSVTTPLIFELDDGTTTETVSLLIMGDPELQHYHWDPAIIPGGTDCAFCHVTHNQFLASGFRKEPGFCYTCHNAASAGHDRGLYGGYSHSVMVNVTTGGGNRLPTYGNITTGEYNNQPFSRLKDGNKVVCMTCHNAMRKSEDHGRVWEYTTTFDHLHYSMQYGGWPTYGYLVPNVYRATSLWPGPTYSNKKKDSLVSPAEYDYDEAAGMITFNAVQSPLAYVYVTLDYPYLRASSQDNRLCSDCHTQATHQGSNCLVCHRAHNTDNLIGIRDSVRTPYRSTSQVKFLRYTGVNSFADGDTTYDGVCEVCHTQTKYYKWNGSGFANHSGGFNHDGADCNTCHSHAVGFTKAGFAVRIDSPFANSTSHEYSVMVRGSIIGRDGAEVGVSVNGTLAEVNGSSFALAELPLEDGANTITAVATDANGMAASDAITVNVVDPVASPVSITASPSSGPAPLDVTFTIESNVPDAALFELDYEGDGTVDASSATFDGMTSFLTHTYTTDGLYYPKIKVTDNVDAEFEESTVVNVHDDPDLLEIWNAMRNALLAGDVNRAATYMSLATRENSRTLYNTLATAEVLEQFASELSDMQIISITPYTAEGDLRIIENSTEFSYYVLFVKDDDGIWRIHSF